MERSVENLKYAIETTETMAKAAKKMEMAFSTFRRLARKHNLYKPNQGRKGISREEYEDESNRLSLEKILNGEYPFYNRSCLKRRLLKDGILENKCSECDINEWNNKSLSCQLDHIDGDPTNHKRKNLRMLCPNCHSQTETFSNRNNTKRQYPYTKEEFIKVVEESFTYTEIKKKLNLYHGSPNIAIKKLMTVYGLSL